MSNQTEHFDAFISYRHSELDNFVAENLQKKLETFKIPRGSSSRVKSAGKEKPYHIFRDREELPLVNSLTDYITTALENSDFLIVICSPRTPESIWVKREIETFIRLHGRDHILAVLIEGEPAESFPEPLLVEDKEVRLSNGETEIVRTLVEPLAADVRASSNKEVNKKIKSEMLRLVAAMLHCSYDDLKQRHKERRNKRILAFSIIFSIICLTFGGFSYYQATTIKSTLKKQLTTQSKSLADTSFRLLDEGDRIKSILVAKSALPSNMSNPERPYVPYAEYALNSALQVYENNTSLCPDYTLMHDSNTMISKLSPSGKFLLCYDLSEHVYVWNIDTRELVYKSSEVISNLAEDSLYIINDTTILYSDRNKTVCLNFDNNKVSWESESYDSSHMVFNSDLSILALKSISGLFFVNPATGDLLYEVSVEDSADYKNLMCFSPDSSYFGICSTGLTEGTTDIVLYSISSKTIYDTISVSSESITDLIFTENNNLLYSTSNNTEDAAELTGVRLEATIESWDVTNKNKLWSTETFKDFFSTLSLNGTSKNQLVFKGSFDLYALDIPSGKITSQFTKTDAIVDYYLIPDSEYVLYGTTDGSMQFSSFQYSTDIRSMLPPSNTRVRNMLYSKGIIVSVLHDSNKVVIYHYKKGANYEKIDVLTEPTDYFTNCKYSVDDKYILGVSSKGEIRVLDGTTNKVIGTTTITGSISNSFFCKKGENFLITTNEGSICLYDTTSQKILNSATYADIKDITISPDQTKVFVRFFEEIIQLNLESLIEEARYPLPTYIPTLLSFHSNYLVATSSTQIAIQNLTTNTINKLDASSTFQDIGNVSDTFCYIDDNTNELFVYSLKDFSLLHKQSITASFVNFIQFDKKDEKLYISYMDNTIAVYDCKSWEKLHTFSDINDKIETIIFPEESDYIVFQGTTHSYLSTSSYELIASVPKLEDVSKDLMELLVSSDSELVKFPFYNLEMLLKEAALQLNGAVLTSEEKTQYFVE